MSTIEVKVPDIGDFSDVPVIEVMVKPGDRVKPEDPLITLESDKATMEVPAPAAGVVKALQIKLGDKVSEGTPILTLEADGAATSAAAAKSSVSAPPAPATAPAGVADVRVPDIGDFKDVPVIEVFVKPGDTVKPEQSLVTLESDKATMDVPSPLGGVVRELKVKLGDKVSEGTVILTLATGSPAESAAAPPAVAGPTPAPSAVAAAPQREARCRGVGLEAPRREGALESQPAKWALVPSASHHTPGSRDFRPGSGRRSGRTRAPTKPSPWSAIRREACGRA